MKLNYVPWLAMLVVLVVAWALRIAYIEPQELAIICESGVTDVPCTLRKSLTGIFYDNAVGTLVLGLGVLAWVLRSRHWALAIILIGMAGMVIHGGQHAGVEYNALGFVLGILTLARAQLTACRQQH